VNTSKQIGLLAFRVIGLVTIVIALLIAALWARDVWNDRKHVVTVESEIPIFAGAGNESCGGTLLTSVQAGAALRVQRIRYWKECATLNIVLPDGREGYSALGKGAVQVPPPLALGKRYNRRSAVLVRRMSDYANQVIA
jgi:hypothetical protein